MIIVCSYLIINRLSIVIVIVPPLRGRLGGGCCQYAEPLSFPHGSELRIEKCFFAQPVYPGLSLVCFCEVVTKSPPIPVMQVDCRELALVRATCVTGIKP